MIKSKLVLVWFLAGTYGQSATRTCNIPSGKAILLSLINGQCNYLTNPNLKTNSQLLDCAKSLNEGITKLDATVDGVKIAGLQQYRVQSQPFTIVYGPKNVDGAPIGTTQAVSDGYWVLLKPLPPGNHTIHFAGEWELTHKALLIISQARLHTILKLSKDHLWIQTYRLAVLSVAKI